MLPSSPRPATSSGTYRPQPRPGLVALWPPHRPASAASVRLSSGWSVTACRRKKSALRPLMHSSLRSPIACPFAWMFLRAPRSVSPMRGVVPSFVASYASIATRSQGTGASWHADPSQSAFMLFCLTLIGNRLRSVDRRQPERPIFTAQGRGSPAWRGRSSLILIFQRAQHLWLLNVQPELPSDANGARLELEAPIPQVTVTTGPPPSARNRATTFRARSSSAPIRFWRDWVVGPLGIQAGRK